MENKNIIIILIVIIVILAAAVGVMFSQQIAKEKSNLKIADKKINVGDSLVVVLTDSHGNPIENETISIKLTDNDGITIDEKITTNSKGKAKFKMEEKGNYSAECKFEGNDKYAQVSIADNITVKKATTELVSNDQTSTTTHASKYAPDGGIYPEYGPEVDAQGITKEYAIANDMHYLEITVDGDRPGEYVTVGGYTARDSNTGTYHTWGDMMENKNIIIILIVIIVVLAAAIGFTMFNPMHAKEPTKVKITSDKEQYEGGELSIQLTDLNKTPISKEVVNITITNSKGKVVVDDVVKTNSKGKAKLDLDLKKGKYNVTVTYGGNENYTGNNTTQKLTIKEEVQQVYAYKSDGTPMYSQQEVDNYVKSKYGAVNYHIQDNGYVNLDDAGYTDDGAVVVKGGVYKDGKYYERPFYENYIMGKWLE